MNEEKNERLQEKTIAVEKGKFLKWLDNYWYHYKWHTIIVSFFLIIGAISITQLFGRVSYDAYLMYVGDETIPDTQYQDIIDSLTFVNIIWTNSAGNNGSWADNTNAGYLYSDGVRLSSFLNVFEKYSGVA